MLANQSTAIMVSCNITRMSLIQRIYLIMQDYLIAIYCNQAKNHSFIVSFLTSSPTNPQYLAFIRIEDYGLKAGQYLHKRTLNNYRPFTRMNLP
jgi:hypothetical protein